MPDQLPADHAIGANNPPEPTVITVEIPTVEDLAAESLDFGRRWTELKTRIAWDEITTPEDAAIATQVVIDARDFFAEIERARTTRKAPFLAATRTIDGYFQTLTDPITAFGKKLVGMIDLHKKRLERDAADKQRALLAEAREKERRATLITANAERAPTVKGGEALEVAARDRNRAEELREQAELTTAAPIVTAAGGKVGGRTEWVATVTDYEKAASALLKQAPDKLRELIDKEAQRLVRSGLRTLAGVRIEETSKLTIRK